MRPGLARLCLWAMLAALTLLTACSSAPPVPDWQTKAKGAMDRGTAAYLRGDTRIAQAEYESARREITRTGRTDLLARAALMRCAAQVASLDVGPCAEFEALRADAAAPERAYADYLAGRVQPQDVGLLPPQHRAVATAGANDAEAALRRVDDPHARLVAAGVLFQSARTSPGSITLAVDTASEQGWRRPLLAWLQVQAALEEKAGNAAEVERLRRRISVVQGGA
ncbi:MAG: hypothetical protein MUC86_03110 [Burkholderiaceae bacterium]|nr:hypothetical protein [Burkholderiaceae bacterium]